MILFYSPPPPSPHLRTKHMNLPWIFKIFRQNILLISYRLMNTFSSQYVIGSIKIFKSVCRCFRHTHWTVSRSNPNKTTDRFLIRSVLHERMNFLACAEYKTDYFCFKIGKILTRHHGSLLNLLRIIQEMEKGSKWYLLRRQRKLLKDFTTWLIGKLCTLCPISTS